MRVTSWALTTCLSLIATAAAAQAPDAGGAPIPPPPPPGCGMVTPEGECAGNVVRYCDDTVTPNELIEFDCVADLDPGAICQTISPTYGVDCAMPTGGECIFADENGDLFQLFCQGTGNVCVETATTSVCGAGQGTCTENDEETCRGTQAVIQCFEGQAWLLECASFGATCNAGICVGVPEGGACGDGIECAANLVCNDEFVCEPQGSAGDAGPRRDGGGGGGGDGGGGGRDGGSTSDAAVPTNPDATAPAPDSGSGGGGADGGLARADASNSSGGGTTPRDDGGCSSMAGSGAGFATSVLVIAGLFGLIARRRRD